MRRHAVAALGLAVGSLAAACAGDAPAPADSAAVAGDAAAIGPAVRVEHAVERDLTGEGAPERIVVTAQGARADSLAARLEIRGPDGAPLRVERWDTWGYFKYDDPARLDAAERERRVRDQLARLVADSAFAPMRGSDAQGRPVLVDTAAIAYDVAAHDWRRANGVADTLPLPLAWLEEQGRRSVTDAPGVLERTRALAAELAGRPSYTCFLGGEESYTIAWSPTERRFVTIWACC